MPAGSKIKIVEKDADGNDDDVAVLNAAVEDGKIKCKWKVIYTEDNDDADSQKELEEKGYTLPEYAFTAECGGTESGESGQLDVKDEIKIKIKNYEKLKGRILKIYWSDGTGKNVVIDREEVTVNDVYIGKAFIGIV